MATIKDVAREAGVSVATVSRVFNDSGRVNDETRRRVRAVAERLHFWPNGVARSLITNRTHAIGVLLPDLHGEFFSEVIRGIDLAARREGLHVLVSSSHSDTKELVTALRAMRGRIDGLVIMAPEPESIPAIRASAWGCPVVLLGPGGETHDFDTVSLANFDGAYAVVRHLQRLGHRRIATITGPPGNRDAQQRLEGYRAAMREVGVTHTRALEVHGDFTEASGYQAMAAVLALSPRPGALFVANDMMAVGALGALREAGLRVPADLALAGFDDIALARHLSPPLTTVHVDAYQLGERALQRLLRRDPGEPAPGHSHEVLPTWLVVRSSCGASPAEGRRSTDPRPGGASPRGAGATTRATPGQP
ncbi:MAG TPA: LacI family DNA-binding transcriptional regulator, partial [Methylomirabilota bacterium]|nr:LacI family DNA-binding transcriptional regulator [Methylomirabilota bacterium]